PHDPNAIWARLQRLDRRAVCRPPISTSSQYRALAPERTGPAFLRKRERHGSEYVGTTTESNQRKTRAEGLHRRRLWEARAIHGAARARSRLRGGRRVPRAERRET